MTDEYKLSEAAAKANRAQKLLDDDLLAEAFKGLEDAYIAKWRSTLIGDESEREKLFIAINIVGKVRDHLTRIVVDGKLADAELRALAEAAERRKRFGVLT